MGHLFANMLLALGVSVNPAPVNPLDLGSTMEFTVEVNLDSIKAVRGDKGWEVFSQIRRTLNKEIDVKGKAKRGLYYEDKLLTRCAPDILIVYTSTLFARDGEALSESKEETVIKNPKEPGNFITDYIDIMCNSATKKKPAITT